LLSAYLRRSKIKKSILGPPFCGPAAPFTAVPPSGWRTVATCRRSGFLLCFPKLSNLFWGCRFADLASGSPVYDLCHHRAGAPSRNLLKLARDPYTSSHFQVLCDLSSGLSSKPNPSALSGPLPISSARPA
jgi:hypothetical protein